MIGPLTRTIPRSLNQCRTYASGVAAREAPVARACIGGPGGCMCCGGGCCTLRYISVRGATNEEKSGVNPRLD